MDNLETAQDQIVMREKLAALGELTAGGPRMKSATR